ncbi:MAG: FadR family transcriptional regulator [Gemmatimonadetes bacterium]|nr:FadR family transcriptional regulator [Gemmatimonadota bacterium]
MDEPFKPLTKQSLSDQLAGRIRRLIQSGDYKAGDRLPPIMEMARLFGVGHFTVREALMKLETTGVVEIRHGSGVYVSRDHDVLVLASPDYMGGFTKKLLLDLIDARIPLEVQSAALAAKNATDANLQEMHRLLDTAGEHLDDDALLNDVNMAFHREIALASGNDVLPQLLDALHDLFTSEQRLILAIFGSRERDHREHLAILDALDRRDGEAAAARMRAHLEDVHATLVRWDPQDEPLG